MLYEEFLKLTGETQEFISRAYYRSEIEPRYMMFDGLSKEAFCRLYAAVKAIKKIEILGEEMKCGFKTQADMAIFQRKADELISKINDEFKR